jgi:uncharacterized protein involved in exopolysaccharide biosynthesis
VAIYVPRARRRRNLVAVTVAGVVIGAALGLAVGRGSAPTVEDRVRSVRSEAGAISSQLRVVSLHEESGAESLAVSGDAGADLALRRTEANLKRLFKRAPWVAAKAATDLLSDTVALRTEAPNQARSDAFGKQVDSLADRIEATFGAAG